MRRVVITGMGAVTPLGNDVESTWRAALEGRSGVDFLRAFDTSDFPVHIAAEVKDFDLNGNLVPPKELKRIDRNVQFALAAANEALSDAGKNGYQPDRVGVVLGSGIGGLHELLRQYDVLKERGPDRVSPTFLPNVLPDSASGQVAIALGLRGPNYAVVSACATGPTRSARAPSSCATAMLTPCWRAGRRRASTRSSSPGSARCAASWPRRRIRRRHPGPSI